ncbi:MAG: homoserine kinase [Bdellovibrionales bacterium]|nr:homoserine kinase [Oligoflexia bacterium]
MNSISVFAPATVANVAVGFDILGFAVDGIGDKITVFRSDTAGVSIEIVSAFPDALNIPTDPAKNTAGLPLLQMLAEYKPAFGLGVKIEKGIPLGSGMGGSAASAVGAVVAASALLLRNGVFEKPLPFQKLIHFALEGEAVASGSKHADNVAPCLYGGFTLSYSGEEPQVSAVPYPENLFCVLIHPELRIDTKTARGILKTDLPLKTHIQQSARLASFILGCATHNFELIRRGLEDVLIEPQRAGLIPGFFEVKKAAMQAGALGCSISGAGPAVFALTESLETAEAARAAMIAAFKISNLPSRGWVSRIRTVGAQVL